MADPGIRELWAQLTQLHKQLGQAFNRYLAAAASGRVNEEWEETRHLAEEYFSKMKEFTRKLAAGVENSDPEKV